MNILCVDYGKIYIEICIGDSTNFYIYKQYKIKNINFKRNLKYLIRNWNIKFILIGYPGYFSKNNLLYINLLFEIKNLLKYIINKFSIKIKIFNENFSSSYLNLKKQNSAKFIINEYFNFIRRW